MAITVLVQLRILPNSLPKKQQGGDQLEGTGFRVINGYKLYSYKWLPLIIERSRAAILRTSLVQTLYSKYISEFDL